MQATTSSTMYRTLTVVIGACCPAQPPRPHRHAGTNRHLLWVDVRTPSGTGFSGCRSRAPGNERVDVLDRHVRVGQAPGVNRPATRHQPADRRVDLVDVEVE